MRILHVVPAYHPAIGGAGIYIRAVSERLAARGHRVTVFTRRVRTPIASTPDPTLPRTAMLDGVRLRRFDPSEGPALALRVLLRLPGGYRTLHALLSPEWLRMIAAGPWMPRAAAAALRLRPDVVTVANWYHTPLVSQFLALRRLIPGRFVGLPLFHTAEAWVNSPLYPRLIAASDAMLANTDHEKRFIEGLLSNPPPVHALGVGVDPEAFVSASGPDCRLRWGLGTAPVVGYVGRMQPQKGVTRLLAAMRLVWDTVPDARLLLAGARFPEDSPEDRAFLEALAALPDAQRAQVVQMGVFAEPDKASTFDACDVFAMPSTSESFGIVFLEAWMRRKPVIGARIGAVASVIDDGVDGLLVSPDSPGGLAGAIVALLRDPARRAAMGEAGHRKTLERFTWDRITDRMERVYETVTRRGRRAWRPRPVTVDASRATQRTGPDAR